MQHWKPEIDCGSEKPVAARDSRSEVSSFAMVKQAHSGEIKARITDMSVSGFKLYSQTPLLVGHRVMVRIPGLETLKADVKRSNGIEYGCAFANPLYEPVFEHIVRTLRAL